MSMDISVPQNLPLRKQQSLKKLLRPYDEVIGGFLGGAAGIFTTHPLDTIRVRLQGCKAAIKPSYAEICRGILQNKGWFGFYAGIIPPVFLRGISFAVNRWGYKTAKQYTDNTQLIGAFAGFCTTWVDTPIFLIKNRVQISNAKFKETFRDYIKMARLIVRAEGIKGLYSGNVANFWVMIPSYVLFYSVYDPLMKMGGIPSWACGAIAVVSCWPAIYPFDVIRTRAQILRKQTRWSRKFFTFRYHCREVFGQPFTKWFPGLSLTLVRAVPRYGIGMMVCENVKNSLKED